MFKKILNFFYRIRNFFLRICNKIILTIKYNFVKSYSNISYDITPISLDSNLFVCTPDEVIDLFHRHYFDIFGSGWKNNNVLNGYNKNKINKTNRNYSNRVFSEISSNYNLINWHKDINSNYIWPKNIISNFISTKPYRNIEIKFPWELSRMYHLVYFSLQYSNKESNIKLKNKNKLEYVNQVLDFICNNPPGFGVNWKCSMDVSIRISNILLAYDIFVSSGCYFSKTFKNILSKSIYDHGKFIINNLEWYQNNLRGNHYFSNIIGLIFCSSHLKESKETHSWFLFSISELINEVKFQFNKDGTNKEGSTCYHRLVSEFAIWGTIIVLKKINRINVNIDCENELNVIYKNNNRIKNKINSKIIFPIWYFKKIKKMINFLSDIKLYDNCIPQIGDNDSGKLFKTFTIFKKYDISEVSNRFLNLKNYSDDINLNKYYHEIHLEVKHFINFSYRMLFDQLYLILNSKGVSNIKFTNFFSENYDSFLKRKKEYNLINILTKEEITSYLNETLNDTKLYVHFDKIYLGNNYIKNINLFSYKDFGVYVYKSEKIFLIIRLFDFNKEPINTGHFHYDQLSIELHINKKPVILDPGTYLYNSNIKKRNLYRSAYAHNSPSYTFDFTLSNNPFVMKTFFNSKIYHFSKFGFYGSFNVNDKLIERIILLKNKHLEIYDISSHKLFKNRKLNLPYSSGYGIVENNYYG